MTDLRPEDAYHKSQLNRLLIEIVDNALLAHELKFKGGTCATMLGYLDRFSVDLDFDGNKSSMKEVRHLLNEIIRKLGFEVSREFDQVLFYQLKYKSPSGRNTLKLSVNDEIVISNHYQVQYFSEIDRMILAQTIETMFANKLVALMDRFNRNKTIAGRDVYDIHHFFIRGYKFSHEVIEERTSMSVNKYFVELCNFIENKVTQTIINEDLNTLLPINKFRSVRKVLIPETLNFLRK